MPPGLYVNDGGETASALSSALANIANNFSPKTQAEAAMLRAQMVGQNLTNQTSSDKLGALEGGLSAVGQLPSALGAEIGKIAQPNMSQGGTSPDGTGSSVAGAPAPNYTRAGGLLGNILAARLAQGGDMNDIRSGIELGQQKTMGPGATFQVQGDIAKSNAIADNAARNRVWEAGQTAPIDVWKTTTTADQAPYTLEAGQARHFPGVVSNVVNGTPPPVAPGATSAPAPAPAEKVVSGPSLYDKTVQQGQGDQDLKAFGELSGAGGAALKGINTINDLQNLFTTQVGNVGAGSQAVSLAMQAIMSRLGGSFGNTKAAAIQEINNRVAGMISQLRGPMGIQRMAGPEISALQRQLPNALMDPRVFNDVTNAMKANMMQDQQAAQVAQQWQAGKISAPDARDQINQIYANNPLAELQQKRPGLFVSGGDSSASANAPAPADLPVVNSPAEARALGPGKKFRTPDGRTGTTPGSPN